MSALPQSRAPRAAVPAGGKKPAGSASSADPQKDSGYFKYPHTLVDRIPFVISSQSAACEYWLLTKVLSLVNQRDHELATKQRKKTGATGLLTIPELFRQARWKTRMGQEAIEELTLRDDEEGILPALQRVPVKEALAQGYITPVEARDAKRGACVLVPCIENWPAIEERNRQLDAEAEREERADRKKPKLKVGLESEPKPESEPPQDRPELASTPSEFSLMPRPFIFREKPLQIKFAEPRQIDEIEHLHDGAPISGVYKVVDNRKLRIETTSQAHSIASKAEVSVDSKGSDTKDSRKPVNGEALHSAAVIPPVSGNGKNGSAHSIASKNGNAVDSKGTESNGSRNGHHNGSGKNGTAKIELGRFPNAVEALQGSFNGGDLLFISHTFATGLAEVAAVGVDPNLVTDDVMCGLLHGCVKKGQRSVGLFADTLPPACRVWAQRLKSRGLA